MGMSLETQACEVVVLSPQAQPPGPDFSFSSLSLQERQGTFLRAF